MPNMQQDKQIVKLNLQVSLQSLSNEDMRKGNEEEEEEQFGT